MRLTKTILCKEEKESDGHFCFINVLNSTL
jgi:hypothetical protein